MALSRATAFGRFAPNKFMEPTYTLLGGDGQQYGPISLEQFRDWVREGRAGADTQVWRSDQPAWVTAADLPELGVPKVAVAHVPPTPMTVPLPAHDPALEQQLKSGAGWFYWIAALSLVNSIMALTGSKWGFALGLGVTQIIDAAASSFAGAGQAIAFTLDLLAAGLLVLFGVFGNKRHVWAFVVGMVLVGLDTVLTGLLLMWMSLAFHVFALFCIFKGYQACRALQG